MPKPSPIIQPSLFTLYHEAGMCVVPLKDGAPLVKWGQYIDALPDAATVASWRADEYALVCGKASNIIALDIDTSDEAVISRIIAIAGDSPVKKIGSKGLSLFYRYNGEKTARWGTEVEILSDKHLTTIPPSKHRNKAGVVYKWMGRELLGAELPMLQPAFYGMMDLLYPCPAPPERPSYSLPREHLSIEIQQAEEMLSYIDPSCARDEWLQIGMALRSEYGDTACGLWHDWSARSATKYNQRDAQTAWRSFNGYGIGIGTLVHKAKQGGYRFEAPAPTVKAEVKPPIPKESAFNPHVDGIVGEIADWITETSLKPQPILSLSAAIAFMGIVKAHRVTGFTNLRTNVYCLSMAPSGGGKEYPEGAIKQLLDACGMGRHTLGKPKSGSGLLTGLGKADCKGLFCVSELGHFVSSFMDQRAGGYQKEIGHLFVELFNKSGVKYAGDQYANERENKQVILEQPNLCILGSSVPELMQKAVTGGEVVNGFLNRWIAFEIKTRSKNPQRKQFLPPPQALVDKIMAWMEQNPTNTDIYGKHNPKLMVFTREAYDDLMKYGADMEAKIDSTPWPINQLYVRSAEHAEKIAMIISDTNDIGTPEFNKAKEIVNYSNRVIAEFCRGITDSPHDAMVYKVLEIIKKHPEGIIRRDLTRATQWIEPRKRFDILAQLKESEEIEEIDEGKTKKYRYLP